MDIAENSKFGDFQAKDVIRALEKGKKIFEGFQFHAVLSKEEEPESYWCATNLEMNVVSTGYTQREALVNLIALMAFHVEDYITNGIEKDIFVSAPPELWLNFTKARRVPRNRVPDLPVNIQARNYGVVRAAS